VSLNKRNKIKIVFDGVREKRWGRANIAVIDRKLMIAYRRAWTNRLYFFIV